MTGHQKIIQHISLIAVSFFLMLINLPAKAQISTTAIQQLNFGAFCPVGAGGSISISPTGVRTVTGDIITLNQNTALYTQAVIEVEAPIGSRLAIIDSNTRLSGSNGGTMTLHINCTDPVSPFTTTTLKTIINIGGMLTISNIIVNPSGKYSCPFYITFIME